MENKKISFPAPLRFLMLDKRSAAFNSEYEIFLEKSSLATSQKAELIFSKKILPSVPRTHRSASLDGCKINRAQSVYEKLAGGRERASDVRPMAVNRSEPFWPGAPILPGRRAARELQLQSLARSSAINSQSNL